MFLAVFYDLRPHGMPGNPRGVNSKFLFGMSSWLRGLAKAPKDCVLVELDYHAQEWGIAAAYSEDPNMKVAYDAPDCYLEFAHLAGAPVPAGAYKSDYSQLRKPYKITSLGVIYGMHAKSLAVRIGRLAIEAKILLEHHRRLFRRFWEWSEGNVDQACLKNFIQTVFGWRMVIRPGFNPRTLFNFPMQAGGGECMRLAACLATEAGLWVCAPVHDAFLLLTTLERMKVDIEHMRTLMMEASRIVLGNLTLRVSEKVFIHPTRYRDEDKGGATWDRVMQLLTTLEEQKAA